MEKEQNWYAAPQAAVADVGGMSDLETRKASRGQRLGAAILDSLIMGVGAALAIYGGAGKSMPVLVIGGLIILGLIVANCVLLHQNGQTIGKRTLGIKIVRSNGDRVGLGRIILLRTLPMSILGRIPYVGALVVLVDSLLIFNNERRCLHDMFADTIVIND